METHALKLALAEDMASLLGALGLLSAVQSGEVRCDRCGRILAPENVARIEAMESGYLLRCSDGGCMDALNTPSLANAER
jgi:hypothetical protein